MLVITRGYPKISQNREQEKAMEFGDGDSVMILGWSKENFKGMLKGFFKHLVVVPELSEALKARVGLKGLECYDSWCLERSIYIYIYYR